MAVYPPTVAEQLAFCETHWPIWSVSPTSIGLSALAVAAFKDQTDTVRTAYDAAQTARVISKGATTTLNAEASVLKTKAADLIRSIKTYAELQALPATVYAAAAIPEPANPTPLPAPGEANHIVVTLESSGAVTLAWQADFASASSGAFYNVYRKLPGQSQFTSIGGAPGTTNESRTMRFTDNTVPTTAAGAGVQYVIQGQRGTTTGDASEAITVQFGIDGGGSFQVSGASATMKIAA